MSQQSMSMSLTFVISGALSITSGPPPAGMQGQPYSYQLSATGGTPPYTWALTAGTLPPGLTLSANGMLAGTPSAAGSYTLTITVTDSGV